MKKIFTIGAGVIVLIAATIMLINFFRGELPVITYAGSTKIEIGKTKLQTLFDAGFSSSTASLPPKKWDEYGVVKDGVRFGNVHIKNSSSGSKPKADCQIFGAWVKFDDSGKRGEVLVNGTNFQGHTLEQVKQQTADYKVNSETKTTLRLQRGVYNYTFKFNKQGIVESITIRDDTKARK